MPSPTTPDWCWMNGFLTADGSGDLTGSCVRWRNPLAHTKIRLPQVTPDTPHRLPFFLFMPFSFSKPNNHNFLYPNPRNWYPSARTKNINFRFCFLLFVSFQSFFGRTYNNLSSISECKNNGECVINKKNRTACKACRLRKCLLVGMSKSGSRFGRRSNWFKIHCLLQEQQHQHKLNGTNRISARTLNGSDGTSANSNSSPTNSPINSFLPNHFLTMNSIGSFTKLNSDQRRKSPSDSGASSNDPDNSSNRDGNSLIDTSFNCSKNLDLSMSNSMLNAKKLCHELISPAFLPVKDLHPYSMHHRSSFLNVSTKIASSVNHIELKHNHSANFNLDVQDEPIDLSVKNTKDQQTLSPALRARTSSTTSSISLSDKSSSSCLNEITKPTPLDLTLVRSKTLSGW